MTELVQLTHLQEEKRIQGYLDRTLKFLRLLSGITEDKRQIIANFDNLLAQFVEAQNKGVMTRVFRRKELKEKQRKNIDEILRIKNILHQYIRRQQRIMGRDVESEDKEEKIIEWVQHAALFSNISVEEKSLLQQLVYQQKADIGTLLFQLKQFWNFLREQSELLEKLGAETITKELLGAVLLNSRDFYDREHRAILACTELCKNLASEAEQIIRENKKIEEHFNANDLKELVDLVGKEIRYEKDRFEFLKQHLEEQRKLRDTLRVRQLIAVHLTDYFPKNGEIIPKSRFKHFTLALGKPKNIIDLRETIHFSLNGPVAAHTEGSWEGRKFAILIPLEKIIDRVIQMGAEDTYVLGRLKLPLGSEVIVDERDEYAKIKRVGNAIIIIKSAQESVHEAVIRRVRERGYTAMSGTNRGWGGVLFDDDKKWLDKFGEGYPYWVDIFNWWVKEDLKKEPTFHMFSLWGKIEQNVWLAYGILYDHHPGFDMPPAPPDEVKNRISGFLQDLDEKSKTLKFPEEKKAVQKMQRLLNKLLMNLERKYPD